MRSSRPTSTTSALTRGVAGFAAAITVAVGATLAIAGPAAASSGPVTGQGESQFVADTNAARASVGKAAYVVRDDLVQVAREQAARMAARGDIYHNPNLGTDVHNWRFVGENVGMGPSVEAIQNAFMNSTEHRNNIEDSDFTEVGIGTVTNPDGEIYVSEVFRDPMNSYIAPAPAPAAAAPAVLLPAGSGNATTTSAPPALTPEQVLAARLALAARSVSAGAGHAGTVAQAMSYAELLTQTG